MNRTLAFLCCVITLATHAGDWWQFRGSQGTGVSDEADLPTVLSANKNIAWKIPLPGRGLSSPIIVGDRIFVTCSSGAQQDRLHVICFNAVDGKKRWERQLWATGRTTCHEKISVAAPTPASDGERIFAFFSTSDLVCLDLDGNLLWLRALMRDYPNASNSLGMSSSPVVSDDTLVIQVETEGEAFVAGLNVRTGINRWKIERPKRVNWTTPLLVRKSNGKQTVALQSAGGVSAIDPASGRIIWKYTDGADTIPSGALRGDTLFVPSHGITALQTINDDQPPKQLWRSNQLRPATASPLVLDERIFTLNDAGVLTCGDTANGNRLWQVRLKGPFSATPIAAAKHIYFVNEKGLVQVVDPAKPEGEVISELDLGEPIIGTPSIGHGAIYFRSDGSLWKITKS